MLHDKQGYVIDHELGFYIEEDTAGMALKGFDFKFDGHIFYHYLQKSWASTKPEFFSEFCEYLRYLNVNNLTSYFNN